MPRLFRNHPSYAVMATSALAISVGVNLLVFTVVNALWIRPLPFPEPGRVVTILDNSLGDISLDVPRLRIFEGGVAGQVITSDIFEALRPRIRFADPGQNIEALGVTPSYFSLLGLAIRGRDFTADDERAGAEPVAIVSDRFWARALGRRSGVIGEVLEASPFPIRVIGVAPQGFEGARRGERADLWIPTDLVRRLAPAGWSDKRLPMMIFARLGPTQTVAATEQRYHEFMDPQSREWLAKNNDLWGFPRVLPLSEVFGTPQSRTFRVREANALLVVSGLALLVLLGGCATVAALVLMHYERRRAELAVKMALGVGRRRLIFELVRELCLVAATGSGAGILVAVLGVRVIPALSLPGGVNIGRLDLSIDWRVCAVGIAVTGITLMLAAMVPVARSTRLRLAGELLAGPGAVTLGSLRVRQALLALQVCATVVVLISAGLFVRAVIHGFTTVAGFDVDRTVFVSVQESSPFRSHVAGDPRPLSAERGARLMAVLRTVSGVTDVAEGIPPVGIEALASLPKPRTVVVQDHEYQLLVGVLRGSPNLLSSLGVPILAGRGLAAADSTGTPHPAVISRSLAERLWPAGRVLGQPLALPELRGGSYIVVGIAPDLAFGSLTRPSSGVIVTVGTGMSSIVSNFVVRTDHPESVAAIVGRTIKGQTVQIETGRQTVARDIGRQRLGAWAFSAFGLAALLLGVSGVFGLVAYLAESRTREYGVRLALGATTADLIRHGLSAALAPVTAGVAGGLALGATTSRLFSALLVGVSPLDTVTYTVVALTMLSGAAIAALAASWRLRRITPADALRST